jgi:hypothetical protein
MLLLYCECWKKFGEEYFNATRHFTALKVGSKARK